ncbi:cellulose synthase family protein [Pontibacter vulgaris]|uniref:cellulose synthase family protein n=1 Tax=Pontibacter vulgaris TaxID=2905679 RepID=UPI001FA6C5DF|nr:cellulose synthase family protein [Pontibacter vulgaris]
MGTLDLIVLLLYGICLAFIFSYSMAQLHLTILYRLRKPRTSPDLQSITNWPSVTVQLPVYNERYVIERLMDAVAAFDYPSEKLQIQLLDDSTDDTYQLIREKAEHYGQLGLNIQHIQRRNREGYKAGALQHGLTSATGDFIAIFDADFVPPPDFLKKTIPAFTDVQIGVVQARWGHLNSNYSLLTRLQAFGLNAHFTVEQTGRATGGHFLNFNGTAGVWRKSCIQDAGGWQADTLTEDLDLSYRAQLKGWKFKYLENVTAPAELPATMGALKSQQFRWTKGAAETSRKHLFTVLRAPVSWLTKLHAVFHLLNSSVFVCVLFTAILSVPVLFIKHQQPQLAFLFKTGSLLILSLVALIYFYWTSLRRQKTVRFIPDFFMFLSMSMGLSLHNSLAVLEGYIGHKTPFIRTPKYNIVHRSDSWQKQGYRIESINPITVLEGMLAVYFCYGIAAGIQLRDFGLLPFHVMLVLGFGTVFFYSLFHSRRV